MRTVLSDAGFDIFSSLTSQTFYVVDTEYTEAGDNFGGNRIISLAIDPVVQGRRTSAGELYREMNPGVSISAVSSSIHGFTDESVKRKKHFDHYAKEILDAFSDPDGVFVAHTAADIRALRSELGRLDLRRGAGENSITVGLADLPLMPLLDTSTLAGHLKFPGYGQKAKISLAALSELTEVSYKNAHNAKGDARATADALIELLAFAAQNAEISDIASLLRIHNAGTTEAPRGPAHIRSAQERQPALPKGHIEKHLSPLNTKGSKKERQERVGLAKECAMLRCRWLRDDAKVVGVMNAALVMDDLRALIPELLLPGQSSTLLGALMELTRPSRKGGPNGLAYTRALRWWEKAKDFLAQVPPCGVRSGTRCPACIEGEPCPRDVVHHQIAELVVMGKLDSITSKRAAALFKVSSYSGIADWSIKYPEVAAYAAWFIINSQQEDNQATAAANHLATAIDMNLHLLEPRLALLAAGSMAANGRVSEAIKLAEGVLKMRTTDEAYKQLDDWLVWTEQNLVIKNKVVVKPVATHPRLARPAGRENRNPYKVP